MELRTLAMIAQHIQGSTQLDAYFSFDHAVNRIWRSVVLGPQEPEVRAVAPGFRCYVEGVQESEGAMVQQEHVRV